MLNSLTDHAKWIKWVFSGIGSGIAILFITLIINTTCSNGAEDKNHTTTNIQGTNKGTTINVGKNEGTINPTNNNAETINHEEYKDNSRKIEVKDGNYIEHLQTSPSFRDATIVRGDNGNPVGVRDNPDAMQNATNLLGKLMRGENVNIQEAFNATNPKFLINSGTEVAVLESRGQGFAEFVKVKILEGTHKDEIGWIHAGTVHHGQRQK